MIFFILTLKIASDRISKVLPILVAFLSTFLRLMKKYDKWNETNTESKPCSKVNTLVLAGFFPRKLIFCVKMNHLDMWVYKANRNRGSIAFIFT